MNDDENKILHRSISRSNQQAVEVFQAAFQRIALSNTQFLILKQTQLVIQKIWRRFPVLVSDCKNQISSIRCLINGSIQRALMQDEEWKKRTFLIISPFHLSSMCFTHVLNILDRHFSDDNSSQSSTKLYLHNSINSKCSRERWREWVVSIFQCFSVQVNGYSLLARVRGVRFWFPLSC